VQAQLVPTLVDARQTMTSGGFATMRGMAMLRDRFRAEDLP